MKYALLVFFGAAGTLARYGLQGLVQERAGGVFPTGTLAVNLSGCFVLGFLAQLTLDRMIIPPEWRAAMTIGFFGAFTTFSSFGWETVKMMEDGEWWKAVAYVGLSVVAGLLLVLAGIKLAHAV
ncbi:MAG TPA: fluoride efflux transporter CrcB [Candidatus Nitrosotenuis sp.]|nr:fluoride efflux transporter CrcB [Candidatus Nitrosotenuis sp.]